MAVVGLPIWTVGVWADTVWAAGVWRDETTPAPPPAVIAAAATPGPLTPAQLARIRGTVPSRTREDDEQPLVERAEVSDLMSAGAGRRDAPPSAVSADQAREVSQALRYDAVFATTQPSADADQARRVVLAQEDQDEEAAVLLLLLIAMEIL